MAEALLSKICGNWRFLKGVTLSANFRWGRRPQSVYKPYKLQLCLWRFHTKKLCSRLLSTEVEFYWQKQQNRVLCHPLGDLGVHGSSMYRWKAHVRLPISPNWTFFASFHG